MTDKKDATGQINLLFFQNGKILQDWSLKLMIHKKQKTTLYELSLNKETKGLNDNGIGICIFCFPGCDKVYQIHIQSFPVCIK
jgi:hypothetical protein